MTTKYSHFNHTICRWSFVRFRRSWKSVSQSFGYTVLSINRGKCITGKCDISVPVFHSFLQLSVTSRARVLLSLFLCISLNPPMPIWPKLSYLIQDSARVVFYNICRILHKLRQFSMHVPYIFPLFHTTRHPSLSIYNLHTVHSYPADWIHTCPKPFVVKILKFKLLGEPVT